MIVVPLIIPFLIWGAVAAAGLFTVAGIAGAFDEKEVAKLKNDVKTSKKIAVLGLQQAGKTTFLRFLQGDKSYKEAGDAGTDVYEEFDMKINDKVITIAKNRDIGGSRHFVRSYKDVLKGAEMAFFLFDVSLFLSDNEYFREFGARVDFLKGLLDIKTYFIATHPDKLKRVDENDLKVKISKLLEGKDYQDYVTQKLFVINLCDEKKITEFVNKVFL